MASLDHDDGIEILATSNTMTSEVCTTSHVIDLGLTLVSATTTSVIRPVAAVHPETFTASGRPRHFRSTRQPLSLSNSKKEDLKEKRIKKTVMVIATFMILASFVLVGVSLSMSDHIDEMGKSQLSVLQPYSLV